MKEERRNARYGGPPFFSGIIIFPSIAKNGGQNRALDYEIAGMQRYPDLGAIA